MENRAAPYVLAPGELRRHDAVLPFKVLGRDIGELLSFCEFTLEPWESGLVLHRHTSVDEAFYMVAGRLAAQLDQRLQGAAGGFVWVPRAEDRAVGVGARRCAGVEEPVRAAVRCPSGTHIRGLVPLGSVV